MHNIPWLVPGLAAAFVLALAVSSRVAAVLGTSRPVAVLLVTAVGLIVAATLTPTQDMLEFGFRGSGVCDLSRFGPPRIRDWLRPTDSSLNVLLFIPLGVAISLLPLGRRTAAVVVLAVAGPIVIELIQLQVTVLGRGCQSGDVFDNLTGLAIGLVVGAVLRFLSRDLGDS